MNGRMLTDAQISSALRAHVPDRAPARLRERILDAAEATTQQRALPSFFGALSAADPVTRRRTLLIAAALLVALALASAAAVGALRLLERDPFQNLSLEPRPSLPGVVAPISTPTRPTDGPTSSAVPGPGGVWIATGRMGTPRYDFTAVRLLDGRVLVAGGSGANNKHDLTSAESYDPDSGTWSATGNMIHTPDGFPATLLRDGRVLAGDNSGDDPGNPNGGAGAEVYDPATGTWSSTGKLATTEGWLAGTTATLLANGKVLVTGLHGAQLYDPDSGTWSATGKMTRPRYNHTATLLPDGRVLVAGGDVPPDHAVDSAELYDPDRESWTAIANMRATGNTRGDAITATLLRDGTVLVVRPTSAALYDPATGTWTPTGDMARPGTRYPTAIRLLDGTVLVAGGRGNDDVVTAEVYDPATRSWAKAGSMLRTRYSGGDSKPATLLLDGTVLVAGGSVCSEAATSCPAGATGSAELYIPAGVSPPPDLAPVPSPPPSPTPSPTPTPIPPEAGPVPPGARPWKVTVVNKSSKPATLFVAEEDGSGMTQLVGAVTPNVVPPGATVKVTFLLPAKSSTGWWIFVNPGPDTGALLGWDQVPLAGKILIQAEGQPGWLSP